MPKNQNNIISLKNRKKEAKTQIIFVGNNKFQLKKVKEFTKKNNLKLQLYSEKEWATLEEIDQYIQEEEISKQVVTLPLGRKPICSLDEVELATIKKVLDNVNGNMMKASRILKIARATLYRKMEKYGLDLKEKQKKTYKKEKFLKIA